MRQQKRRARTFNGNEGIDFVRCRICGDYRRVISARHLSKHGIEREAYIEEYHLSRNELIAKAFRRIQTTRISAGILYHCYKVLAQDITDTERATGLLRSRKYTEQTETSPQNIFKTIITIFMFKAFGFMVIGTKL